MSSAYISLPRAKSEPNTIGSIEAWEHDFRLTGMALGGGSGWVILNHTPHDDAVHTYWSGDHTQNLAWGTPLLVMDMYEHAYQMDYGANAKSYMTRFSKISTGTKSIAVRSKRVHAKRRRRVCNG
jgi:superoxide dismutase, Fe-Mn family